MSTKKEWIDPRGNVIPAKYVPAIDKKKTRLVDKKVNQALALQKRIIDFKKSFIEDSDNMNIEMKKDANVKSKGTKGFYTITAFDGKSKIEMQIQNKIVLTEEVEFAKDKFDEWKAEKIEKLDDQSVIALVDHAFETQRGNLDTARILNLFGVSIKDKLWLEGIELLKKGIHSQPSKRYGRIAVKDSEGEFKYIDLNFSSVEV